MNCYIKRVTRLGLKWNLVLVTFHLCVGTHRVRKSSPEVPTGPHRSLQQVGERREPLWWEQQPTLKWGCRAAAVLGPGFKMLCISWPVLLLKHWALAWSVSLLSFYLVLPASHSWAWCYHAATHDRAAYDGTANDETSLYWDGWSCTWSCCTGSTGNHVRLDYQDTIEPSFPWYRMFRLRFTELCFLFLGFFWTSKSEPQEAQGPTGRSRPQGLLITPQVGAQRSKGSVFTLPEARWFITRSH